jgi:hypothetical protein
MKKKSLHSEATGEYRRSMNTGRVAYTAGPRHAPNHDCHVQEPKYILE